MTGASNDANLLEFAQIEAADDRSGVCDTDRVRVTVNRKQDRLVSIGPFDQ